MTMQDTLKHSIAETIKDYREGQIPPMTPEHVGKWIEQFDSEVQLPILEEMDYVLKKTYFSKEKIINFLNDTVLDQKLTGGSPDTFWQNCEFLDLQGVSASQRNILSLLDGILLDKFGYSIKTCNAKPDSSQYIYMDDISCTGNQVKNNISNWLRKEKPINGELYLIIVATHSQGIEYAIKEIEKVKKEIGSQINIIKPINIKNLESSAFKSDTDILHPKNIPDEAKDYEAKLSYPITLRKQDSNGKLNTFINFNNRHLLEQEFLKKGIEIMDKFTDRYSGKEKDKIRPLGYSAMESLGLGTLAVTYRNCPNNCPLVFWAEGTNIWHPLFPRISNKGRE